MVLDGNYGRKFRRVFVLSWLALGGLGATLHAWAEASDLLDVARQSGHFDTYMEALTRTGIAAEMQGTGPFTLFVPTDEAFAAMPEDKRELLFAPGHEAELRKLLRYHVVPGRIPEEAVDVADHVQALTQQLYFTREDGQLMVNDAEVVIPAIPTANGILYGIDKVLIPHYQNLFLPGPPDWVETSR